MRRILLLATTMLFAVLVVGGVAYALAVTCDGAGDQDPDPGQCRGTGEADEIEGTDSPEEIRALSGDDHVDGNDGDDEIIMGDGNDTVDAFGGDDTVYGNENGDGSAFGADFGEVNLEGAEDSDTVHGYQGHDWIDAAANDTDGSVDRSFGGRGNDHIKADDGNKDIIDCGRGDADEVVFDQGIDTVTGCEQKTRVSP